MRRKQWLRWWMADVVVVAGVVLSAWLTAVVWHSGQGDISEYHQYAVAFWQGTPRFSHLPQEYPPLALLAFSLTLLPLGGPESAFAVGMALMTLALYAACIRWASRKTAFVTLLYLLVSEQALLMARFDLLPAFFALAGLWAAQRQRFGWGQAWLALGTLTKIFPLFLAPVLLIAQARDVLARMPEPRSRKAYLRSLALPLTRSSGIFLGITVLGFLLTAWRDPADAIAPLTYAAQRPVQVESLLGSITWVGSLFGVPYTQVFTFGSVNWQGQIPGTLLGWSLPLLIMGCALVYLRQARGKVPLSVACVGVLAVVLLTNRVFSTQYLIWIVPFVAEAEGFDLGWLALCVLHVIENAAYPYSYANYTAGDVQRFALVVALRNALLLALLVRLLWRHHAPVAGTEGTSDSTMATGSVPVPIHA